MTQQVNEKMTGEGMEECMRDEIDFGKKIRKIKLLNISLRFKSKMTMKG
jgi:hypothetical protein